MSEGQLQHQLDPTGPIGPRLRELLRQRIINGDLAPGARISEAEIAADYGISRQPVREAFIKLSEEGLIQVRPQRGTTVSLIRLEAVLDARFVREAMEADIVKILAQNPTDAMVSALRDLLSRQMEVPEEHPAAFVGLDDEFHRTLARHAGRESVWTFAESLKAQMDRVRFLATDHFPLSRLIDQHRQITDAIEAGDAASAESIIRTHLREVLRDLPRIKDACPAYFEGQLPGEGQSLAPLMPTTKS